MRKSWKKHIALWLSCAMIMSGIPADFVNATEAETELAYEDVSETEVASEISSASETETELETKTENETKSESETETKTENETAPIIENSDTNETEAEKKTENEEAFEPEHFVENLDVHRLADSGEPQNRDMKLLANLPAKYDANSENLVSEVKNQGQWGTCWSFSTISILETSLIKNKIAGKDVDLSEYMLDCFAYHSGYDKLDNANDDIKTFNCAAEEWFLNRGGNTTKSAFTLMNWQGIGLESEFPYAPYEYPGLIERQNAQNDAYYMENTMWYQGASTNADSRNIIKSLIYEYGSVEWTYGHYNYCINSQNGAYYTTERKTNHSITVVGWDDDYPKSNFNITPPGNGAWKVKNSWGSKVYDGGYIYISYYDESLGSGNPATVMQASAKKYDNNYFYSNGFSYDTVSVKSVAQVYEAKAYDEEELAAISFATETSNNTYTIEIYKDLKTTNGKVTNPTSGKLYSSQTFMTNYAGVYTVPLTKPVELERGEKFSIVISGNTTGSFSVDYNFIDKSQSDGYDRDGNYQIYDFTFSSTATTHPGQSFASNGSSWYDTNDRNYSLRINALTNNVKPVAPVVTTTATDAKGFAENAKIEVSWTKTAGASKYELYRSTKDETEQIIAIISGNKERRYEDVLMDMNTYSYYVVAVLPESTMKSNVSTATVRRVIDAPEVDIDFYNNHADIKINKMECAEIYEIYRSINGGADTLVETLYAGELNYCDEYENLLAQTSVTYKIKAKTADTYSSENIINREVKIVDKDSDTITASWAAVDGVTTYNIYLDENLIKPDTTSLTIDINLKEKIDSEFKVGKYYKLNIVPIDSMGFDMENAEKTVYVATKPEIPRLSTVAYDLENFGIKTNWDNIFDENIYEKVKAEVYRSTTSDGAYTMIGESDAADGYYLDTDSDLSADTTYYYKVRLYITDKFGNKMYGNYSDTKNAKMVSDIYSAVKSVAYNGTYDGKKHNAITVTGATDAINISYSINDRNSFTEKVPEICDVGSYPIYIKAEAEGQNSKIFNPVKAIVTPKTIVAEMVQPIDDQTYLGKPVEPNVKLKDGDSYLLKGTDYYIKGCTYSNKIGTGKVVIAGKGNYAGEVTVTFNIKEHAADDLWVKDIEPYTYTGTAIKPQIKVYFGEEDDKNLLTQGTDYTVSYKNNTNVPTSDAVNKQPTVIITAKGNYKGKITKYFIIEPKNIADSDVVVQDQAFVESKSVRKTNPVISYNGKNLSNKKDFTATFDSVQDYKTASETPYIVTVTGNGNYTGKSTGKIYIVSTANKNMLVSKASIKVIDKTTTYYRYGAAVEPALEVKIAGNVLEKDKDYTVAFKNNVNTGAANVFITGIAAKGYVGTKSFKFTITRPKTDINDSSVTVALDKKYESLEFVKGGVTPEPIVTFAYGEADNRKVVKLVKNVDYTLSYKNNKIASELTKDGYASIIVRGKGNYKGSLAEPIKFKITKKALTSTKISARVPDLMLTKAGKVSTFKGKPVLVDEDGKNLAGSDYTIIGYTQKDSDGKAVTITKNTEVDPSKPVIVELQVTEKNKNSSYTTEKGSLLLEYNIKMATNISGATIKINNQTYTGKAIEVDVNDIAQATIGGGNNKKNLVYGKDYVIKEGTFVNNVKKGTAYFYILGKGDYAGEKKITFKIVERPYIR